MHILIVHQNFVDHQHPGGTRHLDFAKYFGSNGHHSTIVASTVDYLTGAKIPTSDRRPPEGGVTVLRAYALPSVQRNLIWRAISFLSFVPFAFWRAWRVGPVDVVLGTSPPLFQLPAPWLVAKLRRAPFVLEVLDLWPEFAIGMGVLKNRFLIAMARAVEHFFYRSAAHIVVNSPAYRDYLVEHGIDESLITVVPMGVDLSLFDPDSRGEDLRQELGLQGKFVVTYAGALGQANDLETILRAAERLKHDPETCFFFAGDGNQRPRLEEIAKKKGLSNVRFGGHFPKERMKDVLAASDVCVATLKDIPEFRTPYPNKVFDYMAAGRPIILGIDGAIREVVDSAQAGIFVPPGDDEALAAAVRHLRDDPAAAKRIGKAGRSFVAEHFTSQLQADRFQAVLLNACA